ncbi:response regulator transcription factor [Novosphingobium tardum]|uniref:Response regulator transcription factor n=1 Tax=Novosphingobium tardum TaxID=1538021 RepID=A0ABV8RS94_9SPHN
MQNKQVIHILEDDDLHRARLSSLVYGLGWHAEIYSDTSEFLRILPSGGLVLVRENPEGGAIEELLAALKSRGSWMPVIAFAGSANATTIVQAVFDGALDFLVLPISAPELLSAVGRALDRAGDVFAMRQRHALATAQVAALTPRESEVLAALVDGKTNKDIGQDLGISVRTVEIHRMNMLGKLGAKSSADAVRIGYDAINAGHLA